MLTQLAIAAICLVAPVDGAVVRGYEPVGQYGGHWGADFGTPVGTEVGAPATGVVTFAGSVAGMLSVTIEPTPGMRVSVSYLQEIRVRRGDTVRVGDVVAASGVDHGIPAVHMSVRIDGRYVDPAGQLGCRNTDISRALRLVTPAQPYPRPRAHRNPWRDLRSDPHRPPTGRGGGHAPGRAGSGALHARR